MFVLFWLKIVLIAKASGILWLHFFSDTALCFSWPSYMPLFFSLHCFNHILIYFQLSIMSGVLVSCGCWNKVHKLGALTQQKFILSQLRRPEVQNQGVGRAMLSLQSLSGRMLPCLLQLLTVADNPWSSLAWSHITSISALVVTWHSLCVCLSSSYKDTRHIGLGPTPTLYHLTLIWLYLQRP